jgi:hypothetical protein
MNNAPTLSPADRLDAIIMALIVAIAARAGVRLPNWLLAQIEDHLKGIGESFALLAAQVREGKYAPLPATTKVPAKRRTACGNARARTGKRQPGRQAAPTPKLPARSARRPKPRLHSARAPKVGMRKTA